MNNKKHLNTKGPLILVSNHPNTLTDPLFVAFRSPKYIYFLANSSLFKSKFSNWFFSTFYCIPIERPQDVQARRIDNRESFDRCDTFLSNEGSLYIAIEGGSQEGRELRKLKTGAGRIALSAERKNDFELGVKIIPIGINYADARKFASDVLVNVGEPLNVTSYKSQYHEDSFKAAKTLTNEIGERMKLLMLDVQPDEEVVLRTVEQLDVFRSNNIQLNYEKKKQFLDKWRAEINGGNNDLAQSIQAASSFFDENGLDFKLFLSTFGKSNSRWKKAVVPFLSFPVFVFGLVNNALPAMIVLGGLKKLGLYPGYNATVKILGGLVLFPIFYALQWWCVKLFFGPQVGLTYLVFLIPTGIFAFHYFQWCRKYFGIWLLEKNLQKLRAENKAESMVAEILVHLNPLLD